MRYLSKADAKVDTFSLPTKSFTNFFRRFFSLYNKCLIYTHRGEDYKMALAGVLTSILGKRHKRSEKRKKPNTKENFISCTR